MARGGSGGCGDTEDSQVMISRRRKVSGERPYQGDCSKDVNTLPGKQTFACEHSVTEETTYSVWARQAISF